MITQKNRILFTFILLAALLLVNNWSLPLWDQDEAAYAGFAKKMNQTGDYVIPDYYFSHDHRKTPLHFWDIALFFKLFGENEFAVRFPSVLAIFGTFLLLFYRGKRLLGEGSALNGVLILGGSILVTALAKVSVTDATLLFFSTLSAFALIQTLIEPQKKWIFLFWLGISLGVLTKGPPILLFTGAFGLLLLLFHPNRYHVLKLRPWFFLPVALAPAFIWGYATYLRDNGDFLSWMYEWYVEKRVAGSVYNQEGVFGTHLVLIFAFFIFSSLYFFNAFGNSFKGFFTKDPTLVLLGSWFISGWFFYEFSPSKLPSYVIVAHVPLALLMGNYSTNLADQNKRPQLLVSFVHFILQFGFGLGLIIAPQFIEVNESFKYALMAIGGIVIISNLILLWRFNRPTFFNHQLYSGVLILFLLWSVAPLFSEHINSSYKVSTYVLDNTNDQTTIYIGYAPGHQPSLPFYLSARENSIVVEENTQELLQKLDQQNNFALILSKEQSELAKSMHPTWGFKQISSRIIDRKDLAEYYICIVK